MRERGGCRDGDRGGAAEVDATTTARVEGGNRDLRGPAAARAEEGGRRRRDDVRRRGAGGGGTMGCSHGWTMGAGRCVG